MNLKKYCEEEEERECKLYISECCDNQNTNKEFDKPSNV